MLSDGFDGERFCVMVENGKCWLMIILLVVVVPYVWR